MSTTPQDSMVLEKEVRIAARPETVFQYLVDPQRMMMWMGVEATIDPRPGGVYRVNINGNDIARGEFVEVVPHSRVVYTWGWEGDGSVVPPGSSTVEIDLTSEGDGTVLRMRHSGLPDKEQRDLHSMGWEHYVERLRAISEGRDPGADPWTAEDHAAAL